MSARKSNLLSVPRSATKTNLNRSSASKALYNNSKLNASSMSSICLPSSSSTTGDTSNFQLMINYNKYLQALLKKELVTVQLEEQIDIKTQQVRRRIFSKLEVKLKYHELLDESANREERKEFLKILHKLDTNSKDMWNLMEKKKVIQFLRGILDHLNNEIRIIRIPNMKQSGIEVTEQCEQILEILNNLNEILETTVKTREEQSFEEMQKLATLATENMRLKKTIFDLIKEIQQIQKDKMFNFLQDASNQFAVSC